MPGSQFIFVHTPGSLTFAVPFVKRTIQSRFLVRASGMSNRENFRLGRTPFRVVATQNFDLENFARPC